MLKLVLWGLMIMAVAGLLAAVILVVARIIGTILMIGAVFLCAYLIVKVLFGGKRKKESK